MMLIQMIPPFNALVAMEKSRLEPKPPMMSLYSRTANSGGASRVVVVVVISDHVEGRECASSTDRNLFPFLWKPSTPTTTPPPLALPQTQTILSIYTRQRRRPSSNNATFVLSFFFFLVGSNGFLGTLGLGTHTCQRRHSATPTGRVPCLGGSIHSPRRNDHVQLDPCRRLSSTSLSSSSSSFP